MELKQKMGRLEESHRKIVKWLLYVLLGLVAIATIGTVIYWAVLPNESPEWTGFGKYPVTTTTSDDTTTTTTTNVVRSKTLWEWMELLLVPFVLAIGGFLLNQSARHNEIEVAKKSREAEKELERDRQRQKTLDTYFDRMSELILTEELDLSDQSEAWTPPFLRQSKENDPRRDKVLAIATTRTLVVLRDLDAKRIEQVFRFLHDTNLTPFVSLALGKLNGVDWSGADLSGANLFLADLKGANLKGADLSMAHLNGIDLTKANLEGADLGGVNLTGANLAGANLTGANLHRAIMIGVSLHEANLTGAELLGANLSEAHIDDLTKLDAKWVLVWEIVNQGAENRDLSMADLEGANLTGANLTGANLTGANLHWADLEGANLTGADLTGADLTGASYNNDTKWPNNFDSKGV